MICLYAITDHPTPPLPASTGLSVVGAGDLAAVCGPLVQTEVTTAALWEHERVVEGLMQDRDLLPVRYGTSLADEAAAARALAERREAYLASLRAVRGATELAVRVLAAGRGPSRSKRPSPTTGTEYLRARSRMAAEESQARTLVHEPLARAARATVTAQVHRPGELLRAAYLVDRGAVAEVSARVHAIQEENPWLRITCTGPWPPYSFVARDE